MNPSPVNDLSRLCLHTITTKPWPIEVAAEKYAQAGIKGITVWRQALEGRDPYKVGEMLRSYGLHVVSLCRGGFFPASSPAERRRAICDNLQAIDEAVALGAPLVVLVCGAEPTQSLGKSRMQIKIGIETVLAQVESHGIKLAIEPLHPMYADTRSAINTLAKANDMVETIGSNSVGIAVDVYHLWWDPELEEQIHRCGEMGSLFAFHISDWKYPLEDILNDRGLMGEGCINIKQIRGWVEQAGFHGYHEVEIFSNRYWAEDQDVFLKKILHAYLNHS
ncbi:sugar phosphate isomerase/epimerase [candidate division KSB1 bacterium]|nr:sugar phosphate isomerase/epimerase [candidate division KSB1 bacterium]RQW04404.1 MAG: sugar phosphate isomerase/epimerase [candidate division KSB1 bacterium]